MIIEHNASLHSWDQEVRWYPRRASRPYHAIMTHYNGQASTNAGLLLIRVFLMCISCAQPGSCWNAVGSGLEHNIGDARCHSSSHSCECVHSRQCRSIQKTRSARIRTGYAMSSSALSSSSNDLTTADISRSKTNDQMSSSRRHVCIVLDDSIRAYCAPGTETSSDSELTQGTNADLQRQALEYAESIARSLSIEFYHHEADLNQRLQDPSNANPYTHVLRVSAYDRGSLRCPVLTIETCSSAAANNNGAGDNSNRNARRKSKNHRRKGKPEASSFVDLCPPRNSRMSKRVHGELGKDMLLKAIAIPKQRTTHGTTIVDMTAGFAQDSLTMALSGSNVQHVCMIERDPIVATLLQDAMRRLTVLAASTEPEAEIAKGLCDVLSLHRGDGADVLPSLIQSETIGLPDIVYLDPMFPPRTKSAAVKKNMKLLHDLLGTQRQQVKQHSEAFEGEDVSTSEPQMSTEEQEARILKAALQYAQCKVVVKRPIRAATIGNAESVQPSYSVDGSTNRFDVYYT